MRPTIEEQLAQTCRLLEEIVAPDLQSEYSARVLKGLVKNRRMLGQSWGSVLPFLLWDNERTTDLLRAAGADLPPSLADRIRELPGDEGMESDVAAAQARNDAVRELLSELVRTVDTTTTSGAELQQEIIDHMKVRTSRYPMRMVPELAQSEA